VTRPDGGGGFHVILVGDVLNHERFKTYVTEDIRFHFKVLYQDPRRLNVRGELTDLRPSSCLGSDWRTWSCTRLSLSEHSAWIRADRTPVGVATI
jgi:hypothetical protein